MSITDELRDYIKEQQWCAKGMLTAIADRIDAEHERAIRELNNLADTSVLLPVDADGEYIRIGDMLMDGLSQSFTPKKVKMLMLEGNEWMLNFGCGWCAMKHHEWHHYHAPTVEDVLREMLYKAHIYDEREMELLPDLIAEYAAKLRLAGDAE